MDRPQRLARKQEDETAKRHGGRVTSASGSGEVVKNDVRNATWSFEVKSTSGLGYRLNQEYLYYAERNALTDGRRMAFVVAFLNPTTRKAKRYVVTTEDDFLEREQELADLWERYGDNCGCI